MKKIYFMFMRLIKRPVDASIVAFVALGFFLIPVKVVNAVAEVNDNSAFLQVYVNNVENLTGSNVTPTECRAEYTDLIEYIKTQRYIPDVFIVQQIDNVMHAEAYATELQEAFGGLPLKLEYDYDYVIAYDIPAEFEPNNPNSCLTNNLKNFQTNAIFYRSARLSPTMAEGRWRSLNGVNNSTNCNPNQHERTENIRAQFYDTIAGKTVSIGSVHWPNTSNATEDETAVCNIDKTVAEMNTTVSDLIIFGGDMNHDDVQQPVGNTMWMTWYANANKELSPGTHGYTDPIYSLCSDVTPPPTLQEIVSCSHDNGTLNKSFMTNPPKKRRIDFLFAKWPNSSDKVLTCDQHTITPVEANQAADNSDIDYSEHRAIRARVFYDVPPFNYPPMFTSASISKPDATIGTVYNGSSLLGDVCDPNGDILSFSIISGPTWLSVGAYDGVLSGTPAYQHLGANSFTVRVSDGQAYDEATLNIQVTEAVPIVLEQSTERGSSIYVKNIQNASQSFRHNTPNGTPYWITKVTVYLSRQATMPNASLEFNIDTGIQGPGLNGSQVSIPANSLTTKKVPYDITFASSVQLSSGTTYYLNFKSAATNKKYYIQTSEAEEAAAYTNGELYRSGASQARDARFTITGTE